MKRKGKTNWARRKTDIEHCGKERAQTEKGEHQNDGCEEEKCSDEDEQEESKLTEAEMSIMSWIAMVERMGACEPQTQPHTGIRRRNL